MSQPRLMSPSEQLTYGMSDIIKLLPESIANQIAAGEVVQRPASVVKELLENAIDAGATQIKLIIKKAGKELIQIIDNGCGMSETDARMCFERHATSKIRETQDLFRIQTMGFRGEALASIAAVAQVELRTKRNTDELGTRVLVEDSIVKAHEPCQCSTGTNFAVKNLFYNVPARRNFLKNDKIEIQHIYAEFEHIAMAHPDLAFSLHQDNEEVFHYTAGNLRQRIVRIFGEAVNKKLVPVAVETEHVRVNGFVGKPDYYKKSRGEQMFFVNKRFVKSSYLHHAVMAAYEDLLPTGSYPMYVLFLELDPKHIDINVHPTKTEIKFDDEKTVYNILKVGVRHGMASNLAVPSLDFEQEQAFDMMVPPKTNMNVNQMATKSSFLGQKSETGARGGEGQGRFAEGVSKERQDLPNWEQLYKGLELFQADSTETPTATGNDGTDDQGTITMQSGANSDVQLPDEELFATTAATSTSKTPAQIHGQYILSQIRNGLMLIDQHAASERIMYEQFLQELEQSGVSSQRVLFPRTIELSPSDAIMLREIVDEMNQLGFDISHFGGESFVVHGMPAELRTGFDEKMLIEKVLEQYRNNLELDLGLRDNLARSLARNAAIRKGQTLDIQEMETLIDRLFACNQPMISPSGRKCYMTWELDQLQKLFVV
jgi:DNA mismatch repair protein MutL